MNMLDETCTILRSLWSGERTTFNGRHFNLRDALMAPPPVQDRLPLIIGGTGERRTLRIAARHADVWNCHTSSEDGYRHKLEVLARHCAAIGRDPASIRKSLSFRAVLAQDQDAARARADARLEETRRRAREQLSEDHVELVRRMTFVGTPEQMVERRRPYAALGARDFLLNCTPPLDWDTIQLVARAVAPALRGTLVI
jgi:alkanesulfonate monooxygenase SsuD/methylene tetrahydromethanopterin reductase-like flavin-dependent oxidoreductase (luciferase family)